MSMYTLLRNQPEPTVEEIENAFQGMGLVQGPGGKGASGFLRRGGQGQSEARNELGFPGTFEGKAQAIPSR